MTGGLPSPWSWSPEHTPAEEGLNSGHLPLAQELQFFGAQVFPAVLEAASLPFQSLHSRGPEAHLEQPLPAQGALYRSSDDLPKSAALR